MSAPRLQLPAYLQLLVGVLYLVGAVLLVPGFLWTAPDSTLTIPVGPHTSIVIPVFTDKYATGVNALIVGMALVLAAALLDLVLQCRKPAVPHSSHARAGTDLACADSEISVPSLAATCLRMVGPVCQVLGSLVILVGCVAFLPRFAQTNPPKEFFGVQAPDFGSRLFQVGSVAYFLGALMAIRGIVDGIREGRRAGLDVRLLWLSLPAFVLFLVTSTLLFVNGCLPKTEAVQAGRLRVVGSICLLVAVVLLFVVTGCEVHRKASTTRREVANLSLRQAIATV